MTDAGRDSAGNVHEILTDETGRQILAPTTSPTPITKYAALGVTTETILWTPTTGKRWIITDINISSTATTLITFRDGSAGQIFMIGRVTASYPLVSNMTTPIKSSGINKNLTVQSSVITAYVTVTGYEEP